MEPKATRSRIAETATTVRVSAVVVSYFTGDSFEFCLRSLFSEPMIDEVIIVDNGNPETVASSLRALQADRRDVTLLQGHGNVGFARACNMGAEVARGRHLLFVNPDAVIQRGAVEKMVEAGRKARSPWIVGGRLVDKKGREQRGGRREVLTPWRAMVGMLGLSVFERVVPAFRNVHREHDPKPAQVVAMPVVSGALMLTPAADFRAIGGFDEGYFLHVEDIDICRRVGDAGGAVLFEPGAEALHFGSTSKASWAKVEGHKAAGLIRYFNKFAASPGERAFVGVFAPLIGASVMVRGFLRSLLRFRR